MIRATVAMWAIIALAVGIAWCTSPPADATCQSARCVSTFCGTSSECPPGCVCANWRCTGVMRDGG